MFQLYSYLDCCNGTSEVNPVKYILSDTSVTVNDLKPIKVDVSEKENISLNVTNLKPIKIGVSEKENISLNINKKQTIKIIIQCPC